MKKLCLYWDTNLSQNPFKVALGFNIKEDNYCKFLDKYNF